MEMFKDSEIYKSKKINIVMRKYLLIYVFAFILLLNFSYAYKQGEIMTIQQGCVNSTYSNISQVFIEEPVQTPYIVGETNMISTSDDFYQYNLTPNSSGSYRVLGHCNIDGVDQQFAQLYIVTPTGEPLSGFNAALYIAFLVFFSFLLYWFGLNLKQSNTVPKILMFLALFYFSLITVVFLALQISTNFLYSLGFISQFLNLIFIILIVLFFPTILFMVIYLLYTMSQNKRQSRLESMGYTSAEVHKRKRR